MIRLEKSKALGRKIRQDDVEDLAIPNWTLVHDAIQAGKTEEAMEFLEYACDQDRANNDSLVAFVDTVLSYVASFGEEEVGKILRLRGTPRITEFLTTTPGVMESLQRLTESQRRHHANLTVTEEPDRYVVRLDPCGSGGRLRRTKNVEVTKKAYHWSWSKSGVPYYCTHCCVQFEIIPIEMRGYPIRITIPGDKPEDPCIELFYKRPELIPEEYFTRVGKIKTIK